MQISDFKISNHVITKKRSYADLDYKITEGFEISDFRFRQRFQDFSQDFQRFQPEAYEISRSEQPLGILSLFSRYHPLKIARKHGRMKLWDIALEHGLNGTRAGLANPRILKAGA